MREIGEVIVQALAPGYDDARREELSERTRALMERYPLYADLPAPSESARASPAAARCFRLRAPRHEDLDRHDGAGALLVFRPIIPRLREARPRGRGDRARLRADARAARAARHRAHGVRPPRRRVAPGQARLAALALPGDAPLRRASADSTSPSAHGSNDLALAARRLRIPAVNMFDYEFATLQHNIGCRLARRVITPDTIPPERLRRYGVGPEKLVQYPGLKEEYYLADFTPDQQRAGAARAGHGEGGRGRPPAARRVALPPQVEPALPAGARPTSAATRASRPSCCRAPAPSASTCARWSCPRSCSPSTPWTPRAWSRSRTSWSPPAGP